MSRPASPALSVISGSGHDWRGQAIGDSWEGGAAQITPERAMGMAEAGEARPLTAHHDDAPVEEPGPSVRVRTLSANSQLLTA